MQTSLKAATVGRSSRKPKTYAAGRICATTTCNVQLSRYNRADLCFNHAPARFPRLRGEFSKDWQPDQT